MKKISLIIPNISCNHCVHTINSELSEMSGVEKVDADLSTKTIIVDFTDPADEIAIRKVLAEINYPAEQ